ncbi:MAG TPA: hypothetical protein VNW99_05735 [Cytophagaceae bacterium]|nr:hypothetical protein [Cytophagaceae bacterium]
MKKHYSATHGKPGKPIRLMVSLLILKLSPARVAIELVEFHKRVGEEGIELIFKESIRINGKDSEDDYLSGDTTVMGKT